MRTGQAELHTTPQNKYYTSKLDQQGAGARQNMRSGPGLGLHAATWSSEHSLNVGTIGTIGGIACTIG